MSGWRSPSEAAEDRNSISTCTLVISARAWRSPSEAADDRNSLFLMRKTCLDEVAVALRGGRGVGTAWHWTC